MKSFYISADHLDSLRVFWYFDTPKAEEIERRVDAETEENKKTFQKYFDLLQDKKISCFYTANTNGKYKTVEAYHRSPKESGKVQRSYYQINKGQFIAIMDAQYQTAADAIRDGIKPGAYIIK